MPDSDSELLRRIGRIELLLRAVARQVPTGQRRVLITGGTGTLGTALTQHFLRADCALTVLSRDAHRQALYQQKFPQVRCLLGDICDAALLQEACLGQDIVIHAAALKRVDVGETQVPEFARVNIDGTRVVAAAAQAAGVARALFISSDKAVSPLNFYGMTKAVGERIWTQQNACAGLVPTRFAVVRYGNVMGSNGSVLQVWRNQLAQNQPMTVREPETTRFFMRVQDAVDLVQNALDCMQGGEIFVPSHTPAFALYDLARSIAAERYWQRLPLGPREKQHEVLLAHNEYWESCGPDMVRVWPARAGVACVPDAFQSEFAPRLMGCEAVERLEAA